MPSPLEAQLLELIKVRDCYTLTLFFYNGSLIRSVMVKSLIVYTTSYSSLPVIYHS
jgi:hypothetical protein